eukprot:scaffold13888_cov24-Tisochrysis_lutea.AAC.2
MVTSELKVHGVMRSGRVLMLGDPNCIQGRTPTFRATRPRPGARTRNIKESQYTDQLHVPPCRKSYPQPPKPPTSASLVSNKHNKLVSL